MAVSDHLEPGKSLTFLNNTILFSKIIKHNDKNKIAMTDANRENS